MLVDSIRGFERCVVHLEAIDLVVVIAILTGNEYDYSTEDLCLKFTFCGRAFNCNLRLVNRICF
jgi:hypothetical protein